MNFDGMSNQIPVYGICNNFVSLLKNYLTSELLFNLYSELGQQFALVVPAIICFRCTFSRNYKTNTETIFKNMLNNKIRQIQKMHVMLKFSCTFFFSINCRISNTRTVYHILEIWSKTLVNSVH